MRNVVRLVWVLLDRLRFLIGILIDIEVMFMMCLNLCFCILGVIVCRSLIGVMKFCVMFFSSVLWFSFV